MKSCNETDAEDGSALKAWRIEQITDDGAMRLAELEALQPGPGEYVVRVEAAGLNFLDTLMVRGRYQRKPALPFTPGVEVAGTVVAAGSGGRFTAGQRIYATVATGGFAEFALVPEASAQALPDDLDGETGTVLLGVNYPTSYYALHDRAGLQAGETVLVHAAAGGVGSAALEIALAAGCRVIATAGSAAKRAACVARGAEAAIDPAASDFREQLRAASGAGVDVVFDPVGGDLALQSVRGLAWHGRYLVIGFAGGTIPQIPSNRLLLKEAAAIGVAWGASREREPALGERIGERVLALYRQGALRPVIGGRFGLSEAPRALAMLQRRESMGKLFLNPE
ncbi:MAG: NADPH:quinone oxidoreductase family protein [Acetobacteraceae bacterium]